VWRALSRKGINTPLIYHVSGICEIRAWDLDVETHEVASSEEVLSLIPSLRSCVAGASEEGAIHVSHLGYRCLEEMSRGYLTHELLQDREL
jgi:hypothetical protein